MLFTVHFRTHTQKKTKQEKWSIGLERSLQKSISNSVAWFFSLCYQYRWTGSRVALIVLWPQLFLGYTLYWENWARLELREWRRQSIMGRLQFPFLILQHMRENRKKRVDGENVVRMKSYTRILWVNYIWISRNTSGLLGSVKLTVKGN